jgi:hypothetical protein
MSTPGPGRREVRDVVDESPLVGGLTGIALIALATLGLSAVAGLLVLLALLLVG